MCERYECKLSSDLLDKAVLELNEPKENGDRLAAIDKLRKRFEKEQKDLELVRSDDAFFLRFLRVRKFNEDRAYETLVNYHQQRKEWKELFDLVDNPKLCKTVLSAGPIVPLKNFRAKDGTFVIIGRPGRGCQDKTDFIHFIALIIMTMEKLLESEECQIHGVSVVEDMSEFGLSLAMQMASYAKRFLFVLQEAMPVRLKSLNMVNQAMVFDAVWLLVSPFMKEKTRNRLKLHGTNFKTLHDVIDPTYLPPFLGGTGPDLDDGWWAGEILSTHGLGEDTVL